MYIYAYKYSYTHKFLHNHKASLYQHMFDIRGCGCTGVRAYGRSHNFSKMLNACLQRHKHGHLRDFFSPNAPLYILC